jgi:S-adenosylmethionine-diacylglycerol 3-amino-3-carboxypropyl transferase
MVQMDKSSRLELYIWMSVTISQRELQTTLEQPEIRYSQVWEDFRCIENAIEFAPGQRHLVIGSAGCNAFNALLKDGAVDAIDMNGAQLALIELKSAAVANLDHQSFLRLVGMFPGGAEVYRTLRPFLRPHILAFFDANLNLFTHGLMSSGRLERFLTFFRDNCLRAMCPQICDAEFIGRLTLSDQQDWLKTLPWDQLHTAIRKFFGFEGLTRGRSPAQMKYVTMTDIGDFFFHHWRAKMFESRIAENFYLHHFFTGQPTEQKHWPNYLREESYGLLRRNLGQLRLLNTSVESHLASTSKTYDSMVLSDIFEYMSPEHAIQVFALILPRLKPGGRVAFWNLLVDRQAGAGFHRLGELSAGAERVDRLWFYSRFHVVEREDA